MFSRDDALNTAAAPLVRPFGPLSLVGGLLLASLILVSVLLGSAFVFALMDAALYGLQDLQRLMESVRHMKLGEMAVYAMGLGAGIYIAALISLVLVARWRAGVFWRGQLAWQPWSLKRAGLPFWGLLLVSMAYGLAASRGLRELSPKTSMDVDISGGPGLAILSVFVIGVLGPLAEEALFRGFIYTNMRVWLGFPATLAVTSVIFSLAHWEGTHFYALAVLPLGLVLGVLREWTGSIKATTLFHGLYNLSALVFAILGID